MGADIDETADGLIIRPSPLKGAQVHSHQDHRMAMSLAIAGLGAEGETVISATECVAKTFPSFVNSFQAIGASIQEDPS
jgi:3-phosphoshikimate 1-carboxyvinyltransferase